MNSCELPVVLSLAVCLIALMDIFLSPDVLRDDGHRPAQYARIVLREEVVLWCPSILGLGQPQEGWYDGRGGGTRGPAPLPTSQHRGCLLPSHAGSTPLRAQELAALLPPWPSRPLCSWESTSI